MALYRCAACGSPNVVTDVQKEGYDFVKGAIGTVALGTVGAVAGLDGKKVTVYKCPDCGTALSYCMPENLKALIDMGTSNEALQDHLKLNGIPIDWNTLTSRYPNVGTTRTGGTSQLERDLQEAAVVNKAKATKDEFDAAADFIHNTWRKFGYYGKQRGVTDYYSKENPFTLEDYIQYNSAVVVFIENCMKYIPPRTNLEIEYRGLTPSIVLPELFQEYLLIKYQELTQENGMVLSWCGEYPTNKTLDLMIGGSLFLKSFIREYTSGGFSRSALIYNPTEENKIRAGRYAEGLFGDCNTTAAERTHQSDMAFINGVCVTIYYPKYTIKAGKLYKDSLLNSMGGDIDHRIHTYCATNNLQTNTVYSSFAKFKKRASSLDEQVEALAQRNKLIENNLLPTLRAQRDELQRPRLFGRKKAEEQAVPICAEIDKLYKEVQENEQKRKELIKKYELVDSDIQKAISKFGYFQVWEDV